MMIRLLLGAGCALVLAGAASAQTWVDGHVRQDGTYVQGHFTKPARPNPYAFPDTRPRLGLRPVPRIRSYETPPGFEQGSAFTRPLPTWKPPRARTDPFKAPKQSKTW
jgi:opacity protein-like surface antigen